MCFRICLTGLSTRLHPDILQVPGGAHQARQHCPSPPPGSPAFCKSREMCASTIFLGYINTTGSISMDPEKVRAVVEWPIPISHKMWQFYWRFIRKFSSLTAPLTVLTSIKVPFIWSTQAATTFENLRACFPSALSCCIPTLKSSFSWRSTPGSGSVFYYNLTRCFFTFDLGLCVFCCFYWTALWFSPLACDIISNLDYLCWFGLLEY